MSKNNVVFPEHVEFSTEVSIRKIDLSMDLHVSFATILDLVFEAHLQFFEYLGYSVTNIHGRSIIFANLTIDYQGELFYKDKVQIDVSVNNMQEKFFDLYFRLTKNEKEPVASVKIRVLFFDYDQRKVVAIPKEFREKFPHAQAVLVPSEKNLSAPSDLKWEELEIKKRIHSLAKDLYSLSFKLPHTQEESLATKLREISINLVTHLSRAQHSKIFSEKTIAILKLETDLWTLKEFIEFLTDIELTLEKQITENVLGLLSHLEEFRKNIFSAKKIKLQESQ
ncbi:MAG: thioesterase family protein [Candidatus Pacearchaeota archaeon]